MTTVDAGKIRLIMELRHENFNDARILDAIESIPRELFIPPTFDSRAYDNTALPIACGQSISQPSIVALMTEALKIHERMTVLEVGTGSGYQAAILSRICRRVYTIERYRSLLDEAEKHFEALGIHNITTRHGDGSLGWPELAPFDRVMVTAAAPDFPPALLDQLAPGGRMVIPLGDVGEPQEIVAVKKTRKGKLKTENLRQVRFVPLMEGVPPEE